MLIRTPEPFATESLVGYVLRVTEANGYQSPWHVLKHAELSQGEMKSAGIPANKLATVLGKEADSLKHIAYKHLLENGTETFSILGHPLGHKLIYEPLRLQKHSICPECIANMGYQDAFFDLQLVVACPIHRTSLVSHCPACNSPLTLFRPGLLTCKCGASLLNAPTQPVSPLLADLMAAIHGNLHRLPKSAIQIQSQIPLDELLVTPLRSLLMKLPELGKYQSSTTRSSINATMEVAANILGNWPNGFRSFVEQLTQSGSVVKTRRIVKKLYSTFFVTATCGTDFDWLRMKFLGCGLDSNQDSLNEEQINFGANAACRWVTDSILSRQLGIDQSKLNQFCDKRTVALALDDALKKTSRSSTVNTDLAPSKDDDFLQQREAAEYLRMPVRVLNCLIRWGHISRDETPKTFKANHRGRGTGIFVANLDKFREQLLSQSPLAISAASDTISLEQILRKYRLHNHESKAQFVVDYLRGIIPSIGRTGDNIDHILFKTNDAASFVAATRASAASGSLTCKEASRIIACDQKVIYVLVNQGKLVAEKARESIRISRLSVKYFADKYVALSRIAKDLGSSSNRLKRICNESLIPIFIVPVCATSSVPFIERVHQDKMLMIAHQYVSRRNLQATTKTKKHNASIALGEYLTRTSESGQLLPRRAGEPNLKAIAAACGFERSVFYKNSAVREMISQFEQQEASRFSLKKNYSPHDALSVYLEDLKSKGHSLPMRGKNPNIKAIASMSGFKRDWFYTDPTLIYQLEVFRQTIIS